MNDKYVKLEDVKRELRYIFKFYRVSSFVVKEKIEMALNYLPYSVKGDLETTLEAADVQPVKHGKWLKRMSTPDSLKCSICGNSHEYETTFCPNCGAKMDGDAE